MEKRIRRALLALLLIALVLAVGSLVAQADTPSQGGDPYFETRLGPVVEKPVNATPAQSGAEGGLLDWSGVDWEAWLDGLKGNPLWGLIAAGIGLGFVFGERLGIRQRLWDLFAGNFNRAWDLVRQTTAGWWVTEIIRRTTLPWVGAGLWVVKQVVAIPGMIKDFSQWLGRGSSENFNTVIAFIRADRQGKVQIIETQVEEFKSGWEIAKALPGMLWDDVAATWRRGWNGLVRMWTDPNVTNDELLQFGADHASMGVDAAGVISVVGAGLRGLEATSAFRRLTVAGKLGEAFTLARVTEASGISRITTGSALRVLRSADEGIKVSEVVSRLSGAEQELVAFLLRKGVVKVEGGVLRLAEGYPDLATLGRAADAMSPVEARYQLLVNGSPGYNITPKRVTTMYSQIGRNGTFLTDARAVEEIIGPIPAKAQRIQITPAQARELEKALGLKEYSLGRQNELFIVDGIPTRNPRRPLPNDGNKFFLGEGKGLPGGGPEVLVDSIPSRGGPGIRKVFVEVTSR